MLERIEGHYVRGYGDSQTSDAEIGLLRGAAEEADAFLVSHEASQARLRRVASLIEGFETPYGMELLSSVHWVAKRGDDVRTADDAIRAVHTWNDRKRRMFSPAHIRVAWGQLADAAWLTGATSSAT